jgi:ubiquinone/menaquinone biosynthesis C-methylase UbiE
MGHSEPDAYRRVARWYDSIFGRLNAGLRGLGLKMLPPREGMDVLDVGCGTGIQLASYKEARCRVSGIDVSQAMLNVARRRLGERADLRLGDATRMPYPDGAFDLVLAATVLHEMLPEVRGTVLDEMERVLRPDGRMLVIDFEVGPVRGLRGWITKAVITISELAAGRPHHRNYRNFMVSGGLPTLFADRGLSVDQCRIVSGGAIGVYLLRPQTLDDTSPTGGAT